MNTKTTVEPLIVERTLNAPIAKVWHALTTAEHMYRWFFELKEFKPEVGFTFEFTVVHEGFTYVHHCKVTEVIPQKRLAYTWRYVGHEGDSLVTFELFAEGNHTRLKLTHEGLETFPITPAFVRSNFVQGWTFLSSALAEFAESPTSDRDTVISRVVDAPRELVWEAMTNPKHVVNWWGPRGFTCAIENMDFRVGGVWKQTMRGPDGTNYDNEHVFMEIVKPERIVLSHGGKREDGASVRSVATWTFETVEPNKTKVTIHMVFPSAARRDFLVKEFKVIEGGRQTLERLGEYLAKM
ncbi:MAG TPA: SRPBCC family protein [Verrucomicrobiae bacterium]|nr:SRPBCC family protein [Verrucomicrobiae bacterium]